MAATRPRVPPPSEPAVHCQATSAAGCVPRTCVQGEPSGDQRPNPCSSDPSRPWNPLGAGRIWGHSVAWSPPERKYWPETNRSSPQVGCGVHGAIPDLSTEKCITDSKFALIRAQSRARARARARGAARGRTPGRTRGPGQRSGAQQWGDGQHQRCAQHGPHHRGEDPAHQDLTHDPVVG